MKAKRWAVWSLALVFCALCGLAGLLAYRPAVVETAAEAPSVYEMTKLPLQELAAVTLQNEKGKFSVMQGQDGPEMIAKTAGDYDASQLRTLLYAVCNLAGSRRIDDPAQFDRYGLQSPRAEITVMTVDGGKQRLSLLAENPVDGGGYVYLHEENAVYLVAGPVAELFLRGETDFLSHTIFPVSSPADFPKVERVKVAFGGNGRDYTVEKTEKGYYLTAPISMRLGRAAVTGTLLDSVAALYADEVVDSGADLRAYGFDKALFTLELRVEGKDYTALFARHEELGYLMAEPVGGMVYRIEGDVVRILMQDYTALLGGVVASYSAGDIAQIHAASAQGECFAEFSGSGETLLIRAGETQLEREQQNALLAALNGLTAAGELTRKTQGEAELRLGVTMRNGSTEELRLIPADPMYVAVQIDGQAHFVTTREAADALAAAFTPFMQAK